MRSPPAPCCAACRPCCRAARLPAAAAALHPRPAAAPPPIAIIAADIQKFSERKNRARSNCRALDCYCMGVVSIQSKRATWRRFSLQPSTNPGGQSRKPVEALLWTPPGSITSCCWSDRSPARLGSHRAAVAPLGGKALAAALPTAAVGAGGSHIRRASLLGLPFEAIGG